MRWLLLFLFITGRALYCPAQYFDTLHLHYEIGESTLHTEHTRLLDSLASYAAGQKLLIYSYADYLGTESPNQHLSDRRAFAVRDYLLGKGFPSAQIMECTGLGRVPGSGSNTGDPASRRTDIFIRNNKASLLPPPSVTPAVATSAKDQTPLPGNGIPVKEAEEEAVSPSNITHIDINALQVGDTLRMANINFYPGRADALPASYPEMDNLYQVMRDNPSLKIRLEGHVCCCVYPDGFFDNTPTWGLSVDRAFMVYKFLIKKGIAPERMQYKGFGRTRPIRDNERNSEEGQVNRRVEIRILEK